jgi:hypothetical protein
VSAFNDLANRKSAILVALADRAPPAVCQILGAKCSIEGIIIAEKYSKQMRGLAF